jgi:hypothetical protein
MTNLNEKVFPPTLDHITFTTEEKQIVDIVIAKLFHIPAIEEFQKGGILRPLLKTLLPQMEKDFIGSGHQLVQKFGK